jgi:hypothetical protein
MILLDTNVLSEINGLFSRQPLSGVVGSGLRFALLPKGDKTSRHDNLASLVALGEAAVDE